MREQWRLLKAGNGNVVMCDYCYGKHIDALRRMAMGETPQECGNCHRTWQQLIAEANGGNIPMTAVWKDGEYQWLCGMCDLAYLSKRGDLFKETEYGRQVLKL